MHTCELYHSALIVLCNLSLQNKILLPFFLSLHIICCFMLHWADTICLQITCDLKISPQNFNGTFWNNYKLYVYFAFNIIYMTYLPHYTQVKLGMYILVLFIRWL